MKYFNAWRGVEVDLAFMGLSNGLLIDEEKAREIQNSFLVRFNEMRGNKAITSDQIIEKISRELTEECQKEESTAVRLGIMLGTLKVTRAAEIFKTIVEEINDCLKLNLHP